MVWGLYQTDRWRLKHSPPSNRPCLSSPRKGDGDANNREQQCGPWLPVPPSTPVPHARKSSGLEAEDAFMELHGGPGSRAIYLIAEWVASWVQAPGRALKRILKTRHARQQTEKRRPTKLMTRP